MRSSLHANQPVRRRSVCTTTPRDVVGGQLVRDGPRCARTGSRAWCAGARTPRRAVRPRRPGRPGRPAAAAGGTARSASRWSVVTSPSASSASPWVRVSVGPAGPEVGQPDPAVDVLAEVDDLAAARPARTDTGASSSTRAPAAPARRPGARSRGRRPRPRPSRRRRTRRRSQPSRAPRRSPPRRRSGRRPTMCEDALRQAVPGADDGDRSRRRARRAAGPGTPAARPTGRARAVIPTCPRNQPSDRIAPSALRPRRSRSVTS